MQKQWMDSRTVHGGLWHEYGQLKRTWEVVADFAVVRSRTSRDGGVFAGLVLIVTAALWVPQPSYNILANPKYRDAFRAQIEQGFEYDTSSSDESDDDSSGSSEDDATTVGSRRSRLSMASAASGAQPQMLAPQGSFVVARVSVDGNQEG